MGEHELIGLLILRYYIFCFCLFYPSSRHYLYNAQIKDIKDEFFRIHLNAFHL